MKVFGVFSGGAGLPSGRFGVCAASVFCMAVHSGGARGAVAPPEIFKARFL